MVEETISTIKLNVASVSDRGLNEKRVINEDSYLADKDHRIFAVADGVGGAQAGEVASHTAIEVLDEAFRHQKPSDDIEDLLEIAIQRANASIYQMSREHPKFARMATTIVVLHLNGRHATIGHVGDSRIYRLTPDGQLLRETEDHSVVEDEVRAGRLTPEQAASHPERNVINRALGAESSVEVDLKTLEVEEGTTFLLCSDGITRHIPDEELQDILKSNKEPEAICAEMKTRCYRRGAEDNFTAVVVQVGEATKVKNLTVPTEDDEPTISTARPTPTTTTAAVTAPSIAPAPKLPPSITRFEEDPYSSPNKRSGISIPIALLLLLMAAGGAFYGGTLYQQQLIDREQAQTSPTPNPMSSSQPSIPASNFENRVREVDADPVAMIDRLSNDAAGAPLESTSAESLYLYGRALILAGRPQEAGEAFRRAIMRINSDPSGGKSSLKTDIMFATAATAIKTKDPVILNNASRQLDELTVPKDRSIR
jgi:serine/threonine protein phosphatase PrpC